MSTFHITTIHGAEVTAPDERKESFTFDEKAAIDGDGTGPSHGDEYYQPHTAYKPDLNSDADEYIVLPPKLYRCVKPMVMGCRATVENLRTGVIREAVVGDVSDDRPSRRLGEISIALAKKLGVPPSPVSGGDTRKLYRYTVYPGVPAKVNGRTFSLQKFGA